ncbi:MAG: nicotinate-nucleotide adenylyltransferase [Nevskiales bacterium]
MSLKPPIGILGGTFDPVHNGHLRLAVQLRDLLGLAQVRLIPSARPPHRGAPAAAPGQRAKWIRVALAGEPNLILDNRELIRSGTSYTVDTLTDLQKELPDTPLCLAMGDDAFAALDQWHQWERLLELAHLVVVPRPGVSSKLPPRIAKLLADREIKNPAQLGRARSGHIYHTEFPLLEISGTEIRDLLRAGKSPRYLLPEEVLREIKDLEVYH